MSRLGIGISMYDCDVYISRRTPMSNPTNINRIVSGINFTQSNRYAISIISMKLAFMDDIADPMNIDWDGIINSITKHTDVSLTTKEVEALIAIVWYYINNKNNVESLINC